MIVEMKWSEIVVGLEEGVGLSAGRRCSLKRSLSRPFDSPMYRLLQRRQCIISVNKIFRVAVNAIMNGFHFPSGRKGVICSAVGDIAASDAIFAPSKGSLGDVSLFISA